MTMRFVTLGLGLALGLAGGAAWADEQEQQDETIQKQSGTESMEVDFKSLPTDQVKEIQQKLEDKGYYQGKVDGIVGPLTLGGLHSFQRAEGMKEADKIDSRTASALGVSFSELQPVRGQEKMEGEEKKPQGGTEKEQPKSGEMSSNDVETQTGDIQPQAGQDTTSRTLDKETIRKAQQALKDQNLFTGTPTGTIDDPTRDAIKAFQKKNGLTETGTLDSATLAKLGVQSGKSTEENPKY